MSLQTIIDKAQEIEIDRRRVVGQTISRSQRIKTAERSTAQPWRMVITPPGALPWASSRDIIEAIDSADRVNESEVKLGSTAGVSWITQYQGQLSQAQLNNLTIYSASTTTMSITDLPAIAGSITTATVIFDAGDVIQPENSRYPYTVVSPVLRGASTTTNVVLHRNLITSEDIVVVGQGLKVGNSCTWHMVVTGLPTYKLIPGRLVQYTGNFELIEKIV